MLTLVHSDVAAVSVAINEWVFGPASFVWTNAAASDHLLHITRRELVVRRQTTLAGDHLRRKRTCGRMRWAVETKPSLKTPLLSTLLRFRSHSNEMPCFKLVHISFCHRIFSSKHPLHGAMVSVLRGGLVMNRKCVMTQGACLCVRPPRQEIENRRRCGGL